MLNKAILMGRLTRDPELRYTNSNIPVTSFAIAVDRSYKSKNEAAQNVDFINCVAWRSTAEFIAKWFTKGRMIIVVGALQSRKYVDRNGENRTATEVVADEVFFGDSKRSDEDGGRFAGQPQEGTPFNRSFEPPSFESSLDDNDFPGLDDDDDDLPF